MRCPFVSRAVYDDLRAAYAVLFDRYHALKVAGAAPAVEPAPPTARPEADPVQRAIASVCGTDRQLRALMGRQAARSRTLGVSDDEIIRDIYRGIPDDDGIPA